MTTKWFSSHKGYGLHYAHTVLKSVMCASFQINIFYIHHFLIPNRKIKNAEKVNTPLIAILIHFGVNELQIARLNTISNVNRVRLSSLNTASIIPNESFDCFSVCV